MLFGNHNPEKSLEKGKSSVKITAWDLGSLVLAVGSWEHFCQVEVKTQAKKTITWVLARANFGQLPKEKKNSKPCILIGQIVSLCPSCSNRKTGHYRSAILSIVCFPQKSSTCLSTLPFLLAALRPARFPRLFRPSPSGWPRRSSPWSPACVPWDPSAPRSPKHRRWAELDEGVT